MGLEVSGTGESNGGKSGATVIEQLKRKPKKNSHMIFMWLWVASFGIPSLGKGLLNLNYFLQKNAQWKSQNLCFMKRIYHPNAEDQCGRISLDI